MPEHPDPFKDDRQKDGLKRVNCEGEDLELILRLRDVRMAAKDWQTFSSDNPFFITIHSEEKLRPVRQLPIETDPPDHTEYRKLVEPLFRQPTQPDYQKDIEALINRLLDNILNKEIEVISDFALPLQSKALTRLLGVDESEADLWIEWGVHVFHHGDNGAEKGEGLMDYIKTKFAEAEANPGDDFFSVLNQVDFRGRKLNDEEKYGFANLAFAGGRDTIINTVTSIIAYLGDHPDALDFLRDDEKRIMTATEEFVRYVSPLTAISRTCPHAAKLLDKDLRAGERIGLCWPSANRDESVFNDADKIVLDRAPNPHVGFGFGPHNCLGAPHARLIIRSLLKLLCQKVAAVELLDYKEKVEEESSFTRMVGYDFVKVKVISNH